jgi:hypothetical protein
VPSCLERLYPLLHSNRRKRTRNSPCVFSTAKSEFKNGDQFNSSKTLTIFSIGVSLSTVLSQKQWLMRFMYPLVFFLKYWDGEKERANLKNLMDLCLWFPASRIRKSDFWNVSIYVWLCMHIGMQVRLTGVTVPVLYSNCVSVCPSQAAAWWTRTPKIGANHWGPQTRNYLENGSNYSDYIATTYTYMRYLHQNHGAPSSSPDEICHSSLKRKGVYAKIHNGSVFEVKFPACKANA